jgi:signal transduction histidine kinase
MPQPHPAPPPLAPGARTSNGAFGGGAADSFAHTGEYTIFGLARGGDAAAFRERRLGFTLTLLGVATAIALLYSLQRYLYTRLIGYPASLGQVLPAELLYTYVWVVLAPGVMWTARRYPVWREARPRNWAVQLGAMVTFVLLHVAILTLADRLVDPSVRDTSMRRAFGQNLLSWSVLDAIIYCALVAVHQAVLYYRVSKDRALRASQLEARLAQSQLQMLRMQLQPHFLFNTLHSISALMHKDVRRADSMIAALSDLLRMSLRTIGAQEVALQSELEFLQRYVDIMALRFGDRFAVHVDVDPDALDARVPNLFLQPLVENAFRHAFADQPGPGTVRVTVRRRGSVLSCEVVDDGRGLRPAYKEGVGLTTTRQRLSHLYGDAQAFAIRGAEGAGVHVSMTIPFHRYEATAADS